jgi:hypothetical protein
MSKEKKPAILYKVEVELVAKTYKCTGTSVNEALESLKLGWMDIKSKGVIRVTRDKKKAEKYFNLSLIRRIFASRAYRIIQSKYLQQLLK